MSALRLNLGCGAQVVEGWVNVDYAVGARFARLPGFSAVNQALGLFSITWSPRVFLHDLRRPLPWMDGAAEAIYTSHTLEHLDREAGAALLAECHRVLAPGGVLRVVVPDLGSVVRGYQEGRIPADRFLEVMGTGYGAGKAGLKRRLAPFIESPHQCMYDEAAMLEAVERAGFRGAVSQPGGSALPDLERVEIPERTRDAVIIEVVR